MESFSRGWSFLKQAWAMAFKDKDLLKPSIYALVVGMIVSVIGIIPLAGGYFILFLAVRKPGILYYLYLAVFWYLFNSW